MESIRPRLTFRDIFGYLLAYLGWFATAMVSMAAILLFRNGFNLLWTALGTVQRHWSDAVWGWILRPIDRFGLVFAGLIWLGFVIFSEQHYRQSINIKREQRLRSRIDHLYTPPPPPENKASRFLHRLGLDILARRFAITFTIPLVVLALSWLLMQIAGWILVR